MTRFCRKRLPIIPARRNGGRGHNVFTASKNPPLWQTHCHSNYSIPKRANLPGVSEGECGGGFSGTGSWERPGFNPGKAPAVAGKIGANAPFRERQACRAVPCRRRRGCKSLQPSRGCQYRDGSEFTWRAPGSRRRNKVARACNPPRRPMTVLADQEKGKKKAGDLAIPRSFYPH